MLIFDLQNSDPLIPETVFSMNWNKFLTYFCVDAALHEDILTLSSGVWERPVYSGPFTLWCWYWLLFFIVVFWSWWWWWQRFLLLTYHNCHCSFSLYCNLIPVHVYSWLSLSRYNLSFPFITSVRALSAIYIWMPLHSCLSKQYLSLSMWLSVICIILSCLDYLCHFNCPFACHILLMPSSHL